MGVTIHFEGRLKTEKDFHEVIQKGRAFAKKRSSEVIVVDDNNTPLIRVKDDEAEIYEGSVRGIVIQPHEKSDSLFLEFDKDLYIQQFCKTQYSDISTHIDIIKFLREIEPHFDDLVVVDEGEFWETNDIKLLEQKFGTSL